MNIVSIYNLQGQHNIWRIRPATNEEATVAEASMVKDTSTLGNSFVLITICWSKIQNVSKGEPGWVHVFKMRLSISYGSR